MVKRNAKKQAPRKAAKRTTRKMSNRSNPTFGAVSTINTAPIAIGNSLRGSEPKVIQTSDGVRIIGRDYGFTPVQTGSVTGWCLVGGMPLTPACMPTTALRSYVQMYSKFKFNACNFHYITSSPTSTNGDVMFYYSKNPEDPLPDWTNNSFLPFILSDPYTVIGPQWTNHTLYLEPKTGFKSCDYGCAQPNNLYTQGDVYLFSKTSSTESPGYVVFDYDITFKELQVNPRAGALPAAYAQWTPVCLSATTTTSGNVAALTYNNTNWMGSTTISAFNPGVAGSAALVYKIVIDITNSVLTGKTTSNLFKYPLPVTTITSNTLTGWTVDDGLTLYGVSSPASSLMFLFATETQAFEGASIAAINFGVTDAVNTLLLYGFAKYIGSLSPQATNIYY